MGTRPPGALRIALFTDSMMGGGAERVMAILANELSQRGIAVDLLLVRAIGPYLDTLSPSVHVVNLPASRIAASAIPLARYLRQARPDCLLSTLTSANLIALLAHRLARSPARLVLREASTLSAATRNGPRLKDRALPFLAKLAYPLADQIIAVSRGAANDLQSTLGIPKGKLAVIYNPILDRNLLDLAAGSIPHPWLGASDQPLVLGAGRLTRAKNFPLLLRAFARLRTEVPARLILLGEGEEREALTSLSHRLAIEPFVAMPGFADNPFAYMSRASVFALSSSWEGLPGVLIQAMACGCPVVSTDCPHGPREILDSGRFGRLVPMDDPEALYQGMAAALRGELQPADPDWMTQFSIEHVTQQFLQVLGVGAVSQP